MQSSPVAPPPGLSGVDEMMPLKVELSSSLNPQYVTPSLEAPINPFSKDRMESGYPPHFAAYDWSWKMQGMAPYLNAQAGPGSMPPFGNPYTLLQAQLQAQQQQTLLAALQQLPGDLAYPNVAAQTGGMRSPGKAIAEPLPEMPRSPNKAKSDSPKAGPAASRKVQTLSTSLQLLSGEDPDCLFIVRRINKLGFKAVRTLKRHFSAYGPVLKVLLAHSTVRQHGDPASHARRRPSSLGFIQMVNADATNKVLALGAEQEVDGVLIRVQRFERQRMAEEDEAESENEDAVTLPTRKISQDYSEDSASTAASPFHGQCTPLDRQISTPSEVTTSPSLSAQVVEFDSDHDLMA